MRFITSYRILTLFPTGGVVLAALVAGCGSGSPPMTADPPLEVEMAAEEAPDSAEYGTVLHADASNFDELVLQADGPVLVDFYADWCGPCQVQAPILDDFARETTHILVVKVDVDETPNLARKYAVSSIPNLKVFHNGEIVNEYVGVAQKDQLKELVGI